MKDFKAFVVTVAAMCALLFCAAANTFELPMQETRFQNECAIVPSQNALAPVAITSSPLSEIVVRICNISRKNKTGRIRVSCFESEPIGEISGIDIVKFYRNFAHSARVVDGAFAICSPHSVARETCAKSNSNPYAQCALRTVNLII